MVIAKVDRPIETAVEEPVMPRSERLIVVVGFDGSASAYRALDAATRLISDRVGTIEVVYVAHIAPGAEMSTTALSESLKACDDADIAFAEVVRARLEGVDLRWRYQRRDGLIAHELIAVADELSCDYGYNADVVIVVGSALQSYHHVVGSVPVALVRRAKYPVVVVP